MTTPAQAKKFNRYVLEKKMDKAMATLEEVEAETKPDDAGPAQTAYEKKLDDAKKEFKVINDELNRRDAEDKTEREAREKEERAAREIKSPEIKAGVTNANSLLGIKCKAIDRAINSLDVLGRAMKRTRLSGI